MKEFLVVYLPTMCVFMSIWLFYVGGIVIIKKQPFILKAYHLMLFVLIGVIPSMLIPIMRFSHMYSKSGYKAFFSLLTPLTFIIILIFFKKIITGYFIFGVTKDSFREPLLQSLKNLDVEFEETIYGIKLKNEGIIIQSNIQTQAGTAQLFCKTKESQTLDSIISELRKTYAGTEVDLNRACSFFYCALGIPMLLLGILFLFLPK